MNGNIFVDADISGKWIKSYNGNIFDTNVIMNLSEVYTYGIWMTQGHNRDDKIWNNTYS